MTTGIIPPVMEGEESGRETSSEGSGVFVEKKELSSSPPMSPDASSTASTSAAFGSIKALAGDVERMVLWKNPIESGIVVAATLVVFYLVTLGGYSSVTLASYAGMAQIAAALTFRLIHPLLVRFGVLNTSGDADAIILDRVTAFSAEVNRFIAGGFDALSLAVAAWCELLTTKEYKTLIKPLCVLFAVSIAGKILSTQMLAFLGFAVVFSVPALYQRNKQVVDEHATIVLGKVDEYSVIAQKRFRASSEQAVERAKEIAGTLRTKVTELKTKLMTSPKKQKEESKEE